MTRQCIIVSAQVKVRHVDDARRPLHSVMIFGGALSRTGHSYAGHLTPKTRRYTSVATPPFHASPTAAMAASRVG